MKNFLQPGTIPVYLFIRGLTPFYKAQARMSTSTRAFKGLRRQQQEE
jgi:hypothetical protein